MKVCFTLKFLTIDRKCRIRHCSLSLLPLYQDNRIYDMLTSNETFDTPVTLTFLWIASLDLQYWSHWEHLRIESAETQYTGVDNRILPHRYGENNLCQVGHITMLWIIYLGWYSKDFHNENTDIWLFMQFLVIGMLLFMHINVLILYFFCHNKAFIQTIICISIDRHFRSEQTH